MQTQRSVLSKRLQQGYGIRSKLNCALLRRILLRALPLIRVHRRVGWRLRRRCAAGRPERSVPARGKAVGAGGRQVGHSMDVSSRRVLGNANGQHGMPSRVAVVPARGPTDERQHPRPLFGLPTWRSCETSAKQVEKGPRPTTSARLMSRTVQLPPHVRSQALRSSEQLSTPFLCPGIGRSSLLQRIPLQRRAR